MSHKKKPELTGRIVLPGELKYNAARREFNTFFNRFLQARHRHGKGVYVNTPDLSIEDWPKATAAISTG